MKTPPRTLPPLLALLPLLLASLANGAPSAVVSRVAPDGRTQRDVLPAGSGVVQLTKHDGSLAQQTLDANAPLRLIVEFDGPPAVSLRARGLSAIAPAQRLERFRSDLAALAASARGSKRASGATNVAIIRREYSEVLSGAAVTLAPELLGPVRRLPYVRRVVLDREVRASLAESVPIIRADQLRDLAGVSGAGIRVGIIDTGVDYTHPALGGEFGPGERVAGGYDFVNGDADPLDDHGHGTHVAGIIGGNGGGIVGVAPEATLYAFKVLDAAGYGSSADIIAAMERALDPDQNPGTADAMHVVNLSLGAPYGDPDDVMSLALDALVEAGVVCCVAAGNDGTWFSIGTPGASRRAITVGSTDKLDSLSWFTSLGPVPRTYDLKPDLLAPGEAIVSAQMGGGTVAMSGTSMATPHMAGVAALLLELHPGWTPDQVKSALATSAHDLGRTPLQQGSGRLDALDASARDLSIAPVHLAFGAVPFGPATWSRTDTLRFQNLGAQARTILFPSSLALANGAVAHVAPASVLVPAGGAAMTFVTLDVDNAAFPDPSAPPYGAAGTLVGTCNGRAYRVPVSFHQHASLDIVTSAPIHLIFVEDHATRALLYADWYTGEIRLPKGVYDVTVSFFPFYTFVRRENVIVEANETISIEPEEATLVQTFANVGADGQPVTCEAGSLQLSRAGSNWSTSFVGFPLDQVLTSPMPDGNLEWSRYSTNYRDRWTSFADEQVGLTASHTFTNSPAAVHHFTVDYPQLPAATAAPLFYEYHPNPPDWGGYFGFGFYLGVPATGPFTATYDIVCPPHEGHFQLGMAIEFWPMIGTAIDWANPPLLIAPSMRVDRGWPIETYEAVMLFDPASWFSGTNMKLYGGLPVWRGMFHNTAALLSLDEGGLFFAPHLVADSYGTVMQEPDGTFELSQNGVPAASGPMPGTGGFTLAGRFELPWPGAGAWDFASGRDVPGRGAGARFEFAAHVGPAVPQDANPPALRAFQVQANGAEADSIDFASAIAPRVRFQVTDETSAVPTLRVREGAGGAWTPIALQTSGIEWTAALPPTLDGSVSLQLELLDPWGQRSLHTWSPAFVARAGTPVAVPPAAAPARLALAGAVPNPARAAALTLRFSLPDASPARLELLDVAGRRVALREVGGLGAGEHAVRLETRRPLRPGVHFARLTRDGRSLVTRVCVLD